MSYICYRRPCNIIFSLEQVENDNKKYQSGLVAGWGIFNVSTNAASDTLLRVDLNIISNRDCEAEYSSKISGFKVPETKICTKGELGKDGCKGDSGGPLIYVHSRHQLIGVVSSGASSCDSIIPAIYTRVASYIDWIKETIDDNID